MSAAKGELRGMRWRRSLVISLAAIAIGTIVLARSSAPLLGAVASPSARNLGDAPFSELLPRHADESERAQHRFNGRSFFYLPPAPPRPIQPREIVETPPPVVLPPREPEPDPGPPAEYAGPREPISMLGDMVFFSNGDPLRVGEEEDGVAVLAVNAPWTVTLGWSGGEYERVVTFGTGDSNFRLALDDLGTGSGGGSQASPHIEVPSTPSRPDRRRAVPARTTGQQGRTGR